MSWNDVKLDEVILFKNGKKRPIGTGKFPVYGGNGILGYADSPNNRNCVIVGRVGAYCGSVYYEDGDCWISDNAICALPKGENDIIFLYYLLKSLELNKRHIGTSQPLLTQEILNSIVCKIPAKDTQFKIGRLLRTLDEKIAVNQKINDNLLDQMQALYKSWFVDFLPFDGVRPESWTKTDIYSLANIIYGAPFASKQFNAAGEGKPIIRIRDLKDQQFATYTTEVHPKGYLLQPGDIVVGMDGEFRPYIWGNDEAWLNQRVCVFENKRPNGKAFLYFTIKPLLYSIEQTQVATTVIHIGKKDYDAFEITLPDTTTLDNFDALTSPMIMQIVSNSF